MSVEKKRGRTYPCRLCLSRRWRSKAARCLRRSRALPRARSPSLLPELVRRLAREGGRDYTHLRIRSNRTYVVCFRLRDQISERKNKARTFALNAQDPRGRNPGDLYRYTLDSGRSLRGVEDKDQQITRWWLSRRWRQLRRGEQLAQNNEKRDVRNELEGD